MTKDELIKKIKLLKQPLEKDGFVIDGFFGSYARNDYHFSSDVDLLYHLDRIFLEKYKGFAGFKRLDEIKMFLENELGKKVDLAPKNNLSQTAKKYILKDAVHV